MANIAIIDDHLDVILNKIFTLKGYNVIFIAETGEDGVKKFEEAKVKPDIIIMCHRFPGKMTGIDTMKAIHALSPGTKVIYFSADREIKGEALKAGAVRFIEKPASSKELFACINDLSG